MKPKIFVTSVFVTGMLSLCFTVSLQAQAERSAVFGTILKKFSYDEVALKGAIIEIYNQDNKLVTSTLTSSDGDFSIERLRYGTYYLKVREFENFTQNNQPQEQISLEQYSKTGKGKYYSFQENKKATRIRFRANAPEINLSRITVYPLN